MPNRDKTGPDGQGKLTGRGLGPCSGNQIPFGRGFGRGRCFGRGLGWRNVQNVSDAVNLSKEEQIKVLENEKKAIENKLSELSK